MIPLTHYLIVSAILFSLSLAGIIINRKNLLLAVNTNFIAFSHFLNNNLGQIFVLFILTVAAAESAIGLAILVIIYRNRGTIDVAELDMLRG
jgi:NADH-quinone oxidoreductase subunit K